MNKELNFAIPITLLRALVPFMAGRAEIRTYLQGVHILSGRAEASDGYTLGRIDSTDIIVQGVESLILPREQITVWAKSKAPVIVCEGGICEGQVVAPIDGAKYPDCDRVIVEPAKCSGVAGHYDPELLMRFKTASKALGKAHGSVHFHQNGESPCAVTIPGVPAFIGVVMPWHL